MNVLDFCATMFDMVGHQVRYLQGHLDQQFMLNQGIGDELRDTAIEAERLRHERDRLRVRAYTLIRTRDRRQRLRQRQRRAVRGLDREERVDVAQAIPQYQDNEEQDQAIPVQNLNDLDEGHVHDHKDPDLHDLKLDEDQYQPLVEEMSDTSESSDQEEDDIVVTGVHLPGQAMPPPRQ